jgi:hypothetical protein
VTEANETDDLTGGDDALLGCSRRLERFSRSGGRNSRRLCRCSRGLFQSGRVYASIQLVVRTREVVRLLGCSRRLRRCSRGLFRCSRRMFRSSRGLVGWRLATFSLRSAYRTTGVGDRVGTVGDCVGAFADRVGAVGECVAPVGGCFGAMSRMRRSSRRLFRCGDATESVGS